MTSDQRPQSAWITPDRIAMVATVVISLCALGLSVYQISIIRQSLEVSRQQQRAAAWPRVDVLVKSIGRSGFKVQLKNQGIGPAKLQSARVTVGDSAHTTWQSVLTTALDRTRPPAFYQSKIRDRVLLPGDSRRVFSMSPSPTAA